MCGFESHESQFWQMLADRPEEHYCTYAPTFGKPNFPGPTPYIGLEQDNKLKGPQRLMTKGITLVFVGHINLLLGAIVHGSILRHISKPDGKITTEYSAANIISVTSGLLSIATGIIAVLVSRNLTIWKMHVGLLVSSFLNALVSAACCVGLLLAISLTIAGDGRRVLAGCNSTSLPISSHSPIVTDCPFDTTRIYDTTLALWFPSTLLAAVEAGLSVWCFIVGLTLRGLGPCRNPHLREQLEEEAMAVRMGTDSAFLSHQLIGPQSTI